MEEDIKLEDDFYNKLYRFTEMIELSDIDKDFTNILDIINNNHLKRAIITKDNIPFLCVMSIGAYEIMDEMADKYDNLEIAQILAKRLDNGS